MTQKEFEKEKPRLAKMVADIMLNWITKEQRKSMVREWVKRQT